MAPHYHAGLASCFGRVLGPALESSIADRQHGSCVDLFDDAQRFVFRLDTEVVCYAIDFVCPANSCAARRLLSMATLKSVKFRKLRATSSLCVLG